MTAWVSQDGNRIRLCEPCLTECRQRNPDWPVTRYFVVYKQLKKVLKQRVCSACGER